MKEQITVISFNKRPMNATEIDQRDAVSDFLFNSFISVPPSPGDIAKKFAVN